MYRGGTAREVGAGVPRVVGSGYTGMYEGSIPSRSMLYLPSRSMLYLPGGSMFYLTGHVQEYPLNSGRNRLPALTPAGAYLHPAKHILYHLTGHAVPSTRYSMVIPSTQRKLDPTTPGWMACPYHLAGACHHHLAGACQLYTSRACQAVHR